MIPPNSNMASMKPATFLSFVRSKENLYSVYVLILFLLTYLLNQLDRYMLAIVTKPVAQVNSIMMSEGVKLSKKYLTRKFIMETWLA